MKVIKREDALILERSHGRRGEILISGEKCMMMINNIEPNNPGTPHKHPHEQIGYLIEGKGTLYIEGETQEIEAQTSFLCPPNSTHKFDVNGDKPAVIIVAFAPPREDYLKELL